MANHLLILHGPNLNLLGCREAEIYGPITLDEINQRLVKRAQAAAVKLDTLQSNEEGALINRIHQARDQAVDFIIINPAGFTHTSIALRDALAGVDIPFVEVHLSNIYRREAFRHRSFFSDLAQGVICGLGWQGYLFALDFAIASELPNGPA